MYSFIFYLILLSGINNQEKKKKVKYIYFLCTIYSLMSLQATFNSMSELYIFALIVNQITDKTIGKHDKKN